MYKLKKNILKCTPKNQKHENPGTAQTFFLICVQKDINYGANL